MQKESDLMLHASPRPAPQYTHWYGTASTLRTAVIEGNPIELLKRSLHFPIIHKLSLANARFVQVRTDTQELWFLEGTPRFFLREEYAYDGVYIRTQSLDCPEMVRLPLYTVDDEFNVMFFGEFPKVNR